MNIQSLLGRPNELFGQDLFVHESELKSVISRSRFLVIGGAGSIGQAVVKELFERNPLTLHVADINENNLAELVRDIRSSYGYISGDFKTFALDIGSSVFRAYTREHSSFDYVLNFSALKHVRSEKDPYTLMRMIETNVLNTLSSMNWAQSIGARKYFCVSTDKAANPVNLMGASKRIMELFLWRENGDLRVSTARFANVAFSDGSLLHSFNQRFQKMQPIVAPMDVKRYFVTPAESGIICLFSLIFGENWETFFPKLDESCLTKFSDIAVRFLREKGFEPELVFSEDEARSGIGDMIRKGRWPCLFTASDTTGEKLTEEFYTESEIVDLGRFYDLGVITNKPESNETTLSYFLRSLETLRAAGQWSKKDIVDLFEQVLPNFSHIEKNKNLDEKM